jgi:hypothetical protein
MLVCEASTQQFPDPWVVLALLAQVNEHIVGLFWSYLKKYWFEEKTVSGSEESRCNHVYYHINILIGK